MVISRASISQQITKGPMKKKSPYKKKSKGKKVKKNGKQR